MIKIPVYLTIEKRQRSYDIKANAKESYRLTTGPALRVKVILEVPDDAFEYTTIGKVVVPEEALVEPRITISLTESENEDL